ncbi:MAG: CYTH domain-containing protein [Bacteroidia bacterium]|nr:CYTH domain-containing protein [Bacteroidia bacterium]NNF30067.1 CYTH domain-containing protein [Flavobacteriaceae bacterium]MBT8274547.1 CYTH domain-containing protein [Bacteroidia bacterium]NNJ81873.1 CYTH domain-containing protein [Flavobacteriaceae bacterium]NNK53990.1 CYTH domain-containing protein [Flavobacteriaceae bacterium]
MIEIERKFLVNSLDYRKESQSKTTIVQGFLNTHPNRTVRIRIHGEMGYITIKGVSNENGTTRFEWEDELNVRDARALLRLCEPGIIEKSRYVVKAGEHLFEIDEFSGENEGLIIAEIELSSEEEEFLQPSWLGNEVTGDIRFYNSQLSKKPYKYWKNEV